MKRSTRTRAVDAAIGAALLATASFAPLRLAAAEPVSVRLAELIAEPRVNEAVFCLWQSVGYGALPTESAAWLVSGPRGLSFENWPSDPRSHRATWKTAAPADAIAIVHTHPRGDDPRPSEKDVALARKLGIAVMTVSRQGIFTARPDGVVVKELGPKWFGERLWPIDCSRPAAHSEGVTVSVASAPAADPDSSR